VSLLRKHTEAIGPRPDTEGVSQGLLGTPWALHSDESLGTSLRKQDGEDPDFEELKDQ
jgi:hypothetical protein